VTKKIWVVLMVLMVLMVLVVLVVLVVLMVLMVLAMMILEAWLSVAQIMVQEKSQHHKRWQSPQHQLQEECRLLHPLVVALSMAHHTLRSSMAQVQGRRNIQLRAAPVHVGCVVDGKSSSLCSARPRTVRTRM
jgi:hypothetical protein